MGAWFEEELAALGIPPTKVTNVGTGIVHGDRASVGDASEPGRMLVAAKDLVDERGVTAAVRALRLARRQDPRLHLVVVGNAEAAARFRDEPGVETHGFVTREQLDHQLDRASLLVLPASYQVWGMVYLEAMAARTPVLALDRFGAPEITEDGALGFLVESQQPEIVAAAMLDAFSDEERLRKLGLEARRSVRRRFSWGGVAAKMAAVIDEVDEPHR
jgi:glycosyltransferase involved in cell wall biosynthesis